MTEYKQDLFRYVAEEFAEDYHEGELQRREFLRRMTLLGGGVVGARTLIASLGIAGISAAELAQAQTAPPQPDQASGAGMVDPRDPAIKVGPVTYEARGFTQLAYLARPAGNAPAPGIVVIHENKGLQPHIQDVARRLAKAGYIALAPDLVSKIGGTAQYIDTAQISSYLAQVSGDEHVANLKEAVAVLQKQPGVQGIGAIGFCFGGGLAWRLSTEVPELRAVVPFYGPAPDTAKVKDIKAAVLGVYGANDTRINAGIPQLETALKAAGTRYGIKVYEGAGHAFNNDTGQNYVKSAADAAWADAMAWFKQYLNS
ncbi:carboxymethylenebutenolidase [Deinococcus metalli]|uniref:Carboxymethylenebutenolidase n=1 Tax=Deinococcus metalli TaxID=1141878 RepID=A0A7W8KGX8_9DEIO|nr:dienelactone hydrolase family protein [Deinococcus metalli]MBB5377912.1 carboxymethylenebutenolidase [Deinococcus metalli]GHF55150.1 carboxymethylenebutenolidase [Deinococcus metalli]